MAGRSRNSLAGRKKLRILAGVLTVVFGATALTFYSTVAAWLQPLTGVYARVRDQIAWSRIDAERPGEILVLVAQFRHLNTPDNDESRRTGARLREMFAKYSDRLRKPVRVEFIPRPLRYADSVSQAEELGRKKDATVVIWGDIAQTHNEIRYLNRFFGKIALPWSNSDTAVARIDDYERTAAADVPGYAQFVNRDLATAIAFLTQLTVADVLFFEQETEAVLPLYREALRLAAQDENAILGGSAAELILRLMQLRALTEDAGMRSDLQFQLQLFTMLVERAPTPRHELIKLDMERQLLDWTDEDRRAALVKVAAVIADIAIARSTATHVDAQMLRARLLEELGRKTEAVQARTAVVAALQALPNAPFDYGVLNRQIQLNTLLGRHEEAQRLADLALRTEGSKGSFWARHFTLMKAFDYETQQRHEESARAGVRALELSRTPAYRAQVLRGIAFAHGKAGNNDRAAQYQEQIVKEGLASSWDLHNLAAHYMRTGRCQQAQPLYRQALAIHEFPRARSGLLATFLCSGQAKEVADERQRMFTLIKERGKEITGLSAVIAVTYLFKVEAADAYFQQRPWPDRGYADHELQEFAEFAIQTFLANRDTRFGLWLLQPLIRQYPKSEHVSAAFGYLHSYDARRHFEAGRTSEALRSLLSAYRCCTLDRRAADWLDKMPPASLPRELNASSVRFANYEGAQNNLP